MERCRICAAAGPLEPFQLREMLYGLRERYDYLRCPACGVMQIAEVPADLERHYPPSYYGAAEPAPIVHFEGMAGRADRARTQQQLFGGGRLAARALRRWMPKAAVDARRSAAFVGRAGLGSFSDPILDVGCGRIPANLLSLRRLGFDHLVGADPFLDGDRDVQGVTLLKRSIHEVTGAYQLITMHHSFEHVPDPLETMVAARALLRPGGRFLVRTPVMGTWFWQKYGTSWWELDPPRHLFVHTVASLERLAADAGLELVEIVWDSSFVEMIASEQIARDIAWREPASWGEDRVANADGFDLEALKVRTAELNAAGNAGRAGFYFRAVTAGPGRAA